MFFCKVSRARWPIAPLHDGSIGCPETCNSTCPMLHVTNGLERHPAPSRTHTVSFCLAARRCCGSTETTCYLPPAFPSRESSFIDSRLSKSSFAKSHPLALLRSEKDSVGSSGMQRLKSAYVERHFRKSRIFFEFRLDNDALYHLYMDPSIS